METRGSFWAATQSSLSTGDASSLSWWNPTSRCCFSIFSCSNPYLCIMNKLTFSGIWVIILNDIYDYKSLELDHIIYLNFHTMPFSCVFYFIPQSSQVKSCSSKIIPGIYSHTYIAVSFSMFSVYHMFLYNL